MHQRQLSGPVLFEHDKVRGLVRIRYDEKSLDEDWLQQLLFRCPQLLPVHEIEPVFEGLIPLARELQTNCGPLDLLFVNSNGYLTLVETKLWRNPEARRQVVAQIIDYAKELSRYTYDELNRLISSAIRSSDSDPMLRAAQGRSEDFDRVHFIDMVTRNLRDGRFLLLIVGDGIREGVEQMAEFLQGTPQLGFTLGLLEIGLYQVVEGSNDKLFVQPRILARTKEITRAVIEIHNQSDNAAHDVTVPTNAAVTSGSVNKLSREDFLRRVAENLGLKAAEFATWILDNAIAHKLRLHWGKNSVSLLYDDVDSGHIFNLGLLEHS